MPLRDGNLLMAVDDMEPGSFLSNDEYNQYEDIIHNTYWYVFDIQKEEIIEERRLDEREKEYQQKITNLIPNNNNYFIITV